jgi:hypothetical protein
MDMTSLCPKIEQSLADIGTEFERLDEPSPDGGAWAYEINEDFSGFVTCENNTDDLNIPTISISLSLGPVTDLTRDDLLDLMDINGDLLGASLTVTPPLAEEGDRFLLLQRRIPAEKFDPTQVKDTITHLIHLTEIFFTEDED